MGKETAPCVPGVPGWRAWVLALAFSDLCVLGHISSSWPQWYHLINDYLTPMGPDIFTIKPVVFLQGGGATSFKLSWQPDHLLPTPLVCLFTSDYEFQNITVFWIDWVMLWSHKDVCMAI